ncbi:membrane protein, partial [Dietzia sp. SLG510A3-40A3]|nr:membrane protein [Dietzia sp. SLG510A3-40A3]
SVLYVEPIYTQRKDQDSAFPRLLRVMVSYDRAVGYAPTLYEALRQVGIEADPDVVRIDESGEAEAEAEEGAARPAEGAAPRPSSPATGGGADDSERAAAVRELNSALNAVRSAQSGGDLSDLGQALEDLQAAVDAYQGLGN